MLKKHCSNDHLNWDKYIPVVEFVYHSTYQNSIRTSPFEMGIGCKSDTRKQISSWRFCFSLPRCLWSKPKILQNSASILYGPFKLVEKILDNSFDVGFKPFFHRYFILVYHPKHLQQLLVELVLPSNLQIMSTSNNFLT